MSSMKWKNWGGIGRNCWKSVGEGGEGGRKAEGLWPFPFCKCFELIKAPNGCHFSFYPTNKKDTAFRLNTIKSMTRLQAYNHTISTLNNYRRELGVSEVFANQTKWTIWGSIYFSMTVYTTIVCTTNQLSNYATLCASIYHFFSFLFVRAMATLCR